MQPVEPVGSAVDLFCGLGGSSQGAVEAGLEVRLAVDRWDVALRWHEQNHSLTEHLLADVAALDLDRVPAHDVLQASPPCTKHSRARGAKPGPSDDEVAQLARVGDVLLHRRPALAVLENVTEFLLWPAWAAWKERMRSAGWSTYEQVLLAADHGVCQERLRVYATLTRSAAPLEWSLEALPRSTASALLNDPDDGLNRWNPIGGTSHAPATMRRYEQGRRDCGPEFLLPYYKSARTGRTLDRPLPTISTRPHWALVAPNPEGGDRTRMLTVGELRRGMGFPDTYRLPRNMATAIHLLGNAVCPPVMMRILRHVLPQL